MVREHSWPSSAKSAERMEGAMIALGAMLSRIVVRDEVVEEVWRGEFGAPRAPRSSSPVAKRVAYDVGFMLE